MVNLNWSLVNHDQTDDVNPTPPTDNDMTIHQPMIRHPISSFLGVSEQIGDPQN